MGLVSVWIFGSSLIKHAWMQARNRPGGSNLSLQDHGIRLWWQGYSGLKIRQVLNRMKTLMKLEEAPQFIFLHFGGNDLGEQPVGDLRFHVKGILKSLQKLLPNTRIVWSQILPRKNWRYSQNDKAMERARVRVNSAAATEAIRLGGAYIKYPDIKCASTELWAEDGVHLSKLGNQLFLNILQGAIESFVYTQTVLYPY